MDARRAARHAQRGQTLPIWALAILTALCLMFFALNYANVIRWQVRAQNAADAAATAALSVQATQWNKMTAILYAADVEEWRIRHLMQAMIDASNGSGGCSMAGGTCLSIYQSLRQQYMKAVNRYTTEIAMLASLSSHGESAHAADATKIIQDLKATCASTTVLADCPFTYHIIDYSSRTTSQQAGKDAFYVQLGGFTSPEDSAPVADWEPAQIEIATCATVAPLISFSILGYGPTAFTVIGRAAATNVTQTSEWFQPGLLQNPGNHNALFQPAEVYDARDDTFAANSSPRDWYETNYPGIAYKAYTGNINNYNGTVGDDFEVMVCWWAAVPELPYITAPQSQTTLCTQT